MRRVSIGGGGGREGGGGTEGGRGEGGRSRSGNKEIKKLQHEQSYIRLLFALCVS